MTIPLFSGILAEELNVYSLSKQGWNVLEEKKYIDERPGLKPYKNLRRDVQVIQYRLERGEEVVFCRVEYDSQQDKILEFCTPKPVKALEE